MTPPARPNRRSVGATYIRRFNSGALGLPDHGCYITVSQSEFSRWYCPRHALFSVVEGMRTRPTMPMLLGAAWDAWKRDVCNAPIPWDVAVSKTFNTGKAGSRIAKDPGRVGLVLDLVRWAHARGRVVLVLLARVTAVPTLVRELAGVGIDAVGLTGKETRPSRVNALRRVRAGQVRVVVATTVADEGLDLPEADTLVNANPGKASGTSTQRVGRICRPKGLEPLVFDLVDGGSNFARQWSARSSAYRKAYGDMAVPHRRPLSWSEVRALVERRPSK